MTDFLSPEQFADRLLARSAEIFGMDPGLSGAIPTPRRDALYRQIASADTLDEAIRIAKASGLFPESKVNQAAGIRTSGSAFRTVAAQVAQATGAISNITAAGGAIGVDEATGGIVTTSGDMFDPATGEVILPDAPSADRNLIGVPSDYVPPFNPPSFGFDISLSGRNGYPRLPLDRYGEGFEPYSDGDQWSLFAGLSTEQKAALQRDMVDAGLLGEKTYSEGLWDVPTVRAMTELLTISNGNGRYWNEVLTDLKKNPVEVDKPKRAGFVAPAYLAPDYATLAQAAKAAIRDNLGRDPQDWEITLLADRIAADSRASFDAQTQASRLEYDAGNRAVDTGAAQSAGTVQGVDPNARFQQRFEQLYAPEIDRNKRTQETSANLGLLMRSIGAIDSQVAQ